jgi:hypothetical protein
MKVHKNTDDLHKEISELKDTLEGFKKLVEVQQRPSVRAPLNLLREIFTCTVVHASRSL